jgi:hypothetical protein
MRYFSRFAPVRAVNDLRVYLSQRRPYEVVFLVVAIMLTVTVIAGFVVDSHIEQPYKREIVYVQDWRADRSEAEIRAAQFRDMAVKTRRDAAIEKAKVDRKASFKRLDDKLDKWGI